MENENAGLRVRVTPTYSTMPEVIARALFGAATTEAVEPEPQFPTGNEPFGFFARPSVIEKTEEQEERELECPLAAKFLSPVVNKPTPFTLPELPYVSPADFDPEEINANPIRRFVCDRAASIAKGTASTTPTERRFPISEKSGTPPATEDWDSELAKAETRESRPELNYRVRIGEDGQTVWREGYDATGDLKSAFVVEDLQEARLLLLKHRVEKRLEDQGATDENDD